MDLTIPPPLATLILDTPVGDPWIDVIVEFESRLEALKLRGRVKAARDLLEVAEGLRIVVRRIVRIAAFPDRSRQGCHEATSTFPGYADPNPNEYDYQFKCLTELSVHKVSAAICVLATAGSDSSQRSSTSLRWNGSNLLRDWLQEIYTKFGVD